MLPLSTQPLGVPDGVGVGVPPVVPLISTNAVVAEPSYPPTATAVSPTCVPAGNARRWFRFGPLLQVFRTRVVDLQDVRRIRGEHCLLARFRRGARTEEGIATTEYPQLAPDHRRAWHVDAGGEIGSLRPRVRHNVVIVQGVKVGVSEVASPAM